jgi:hypothetical protein
MILAEGVASYTTRKEELCACGNAALAHEPDEDMQVWLLAAGAARWKAIKTTRTKINLQKAEYLGVPNTRVIQDPKFDLPGEGGATSAAIAE